MAAVRAEGRVVLKDDEFVAHDAAGVGRAVGVRAQAGHALLALGVGVGGVGRTRQRQLVRTGSLRLAQSVATQARQRPQGSIALGAVTLSLVVLSLDDDHANGEEQVCRASHDDHRRNRSPPRGSRFNTTSPLTAAQLSATDAGRR